ncbi:MAG: twin-arginine translocation signal domain-containing protein [Phycisphaerae bacterium]|nr:twin-arginine translocation signal domain-containing protein [Phycisphaerae bacterium]
MSEDRITRRQFVKEGSAAAAGFALAASGCEQARKSEVGKPGEGHKEPSQRAEGKPLNYHPKMNYRKLGKSNLMVSEISLGGHWKNREGNRFWGEFADDKCPEDVKQNRTAVVSKCIELGINYVDRLGDHMYANLPPDYQWLRNFEWI